MKYLFAYLVFPFVFMLGYMMVVGLLSAVILEPLGIQVPALLSTLVFVVILVFSYLHAKLATQYYKIPENGLWTSIRLSFLELLGYARFFRKSGRREGEENEGREDDWKKEQDDWQAR
jgi:ABC-type transport system involved in cytochrome bd biosynthesis fused ATPase/permease subunit